MDFIKRVWLVLIGSTLLLSLEDGAFLPGSIREKEGTFVQAIIRNLTCGLSFSNNKVLKLYSKNKSVERTTSEQESEIIWQDEQLYEQRSNHIIETIRSSCKKYSVTEEINDLWNIIDWPGMITLLQAYTNLKFSKPAKHTLSFYETLLCFIESFLKFLPYVFIEEILNILYKELRTKIYYYGSYEQFIEVVTCSHDYTIEAITFVVNKSLLFIISMLEVFYSYACEANRIYQDSLYEAFTQLKEDRFLLQSWLLQLMRLNT